MHFLLLLLSGIPLALGAETASPAPQSLAASSSNGIIAVDRVENQTIYFTGKPNTPKPLKTELYDLAFIAALSPESASIPYFLFAANPCADCTTERALYLIRPLATPQITSFVYPGHVIDGKSHQLVLESRGFYGQCVRGGDGSDQYVVFQRENVDRRHRGLNSVFVAQASGDYLRERLIDRGLPRLSSTLQQVRWKHCKEIVGRSRVMPIKPRGMDWRNLKQEDEDTDTDENDDTDTSDMPAGASDQPPPTQTQK
jgi:hypothetical protein